MSFFTDYLEYVGETEAPTIFHRWTALSILGTLLGRQVHIPFGHGEIYPNQYIMLMGSPGTRKGTAMKIGRRLLREMGYTRFCPDRLSKEQFLREMKPYDAIDADTDIENLVMDSPYEIYAFAEEFTDLVGQGGMEFMTMLTKLWDNHDEYTHPKIHGVSVVVNKPTVNLFGGNTVQGLALAIPPEALGNGFLSRMLFIYSEAKQNKITFPSPPNKKLEKNLVDRLIKMRELRGSISYHKDSREVLDKIYKKDIGVEDIRFKHYSTRRFTHLLKLCTIIATSDLRMEITKEDAITANTFLHYAEVRMPRALGEYGKSKYSDVSNLIMEELNKSDKPMDQRELWKVVAKDLAKLSELGEVMRNLINANKIQVVTVGTKQGYLPKHDITKQWDSDLIDDNCMTDEEII